MSVEMSQWCLRGFCFCYCVLLWYLCFAVLNTLGCHSPPDVSSVPVAVDQSWEAVWAPQMCLLFAAAAWQRASSARLRHVRLPPGVRSGLHRRFHLLLTAANCGWAALAPVVLPVEKHELCWQTLTFLRSNQSFLAVCCRETKTISNFLRDASTPQTADDRKKQTKPETKGLFSSHQCQFSFFIANCASRTRTMRWCTRGVWSVTDEEADSVLSDSDSPLPVTSLTSHSARAEGWSAR